MPVGPGVNRPYLVLEQDGSGAVVNGSALCAATVIGNYGIVKVKGHRRCQLGAPYIYTANNPRS